ncbi:MAG TPA: hypothetical protein PK097_07020, partial [Faecalibacterium prausnitzii]|nr:hypothetical protein [Faecalibacterium prausnitzii]
MCETDAILNLYQLSLPLLYASLQKSQGSGIFYFFSCGIHTDPYIRCCHAKKAPLSPAGKAALCVLQC